MMKFNIMAFSIVFLFMNVNSAIAGGRHGYHYNSHHHGGHHKHYSHGYSRHHYSHYDNHGHNAAYALGGLIVGGILGAALTSSYNSSSYNNSPRDYGYRKPDHSAPYTVNNVIRPSYMLQPNGECYLISHVSNGNMVLSPASPRNCE